MHQLSTDHPDGLDVWVSWVGRATAGEECVQGNTLMVWRVFSSFCFSFWVLPDISVRLSYPPLSPLGHILLFFLRAKFFGRRIVARSICGGEGWGGGVEGLVSNRNAYDVDL